MKRALILLIGISVVAFALMATQRASSSKRVSLFDTASMDIGSPVAPRPTAAPLPHTPTAPASPIAPASPAASETPPTDLAPATSSAVVPSQPQDFTNTSNDLRNSQTRLNAIDKVSSEADRLFAVPGGIGDFGQWTVNQQDMDQQDYQTSDGAITKWFSEDGQPRAEEAQLNDGQLVDRWYHDDGSVEQVMHQYDKLNSYSVYYYPTGEIEATRTIKDGNEIFVKYDQSGAEIQRTYTPAN